MNREQLQRIHEMLIQLDAAISASDGPALVEVMGALDRMVSDERSVLPPRLVHFLAQRSYPKARAWLAEQLANGA